MNKSQSRIIKNAIIEGIHFSGNFYFTFNQKKYFVPKVLPNEIINAQVQNRRIGFRTAKAMEILKNSEYRLNVYCPYYEECGGCNFMHIQYNEQLNLKRQLVQNSFYKYNIPYKLNIPEPANKIIQYRNKATFDVLQNNQEIYSGFHPLWDKKIINIESCIILQPEINRLHSIIKTWLQKNSNTTKHIKQYTIRINNKSEAIIIFLLKPFSSLNNSVIENIKPYFIGIYTLCENNFFVLYETKNFYENVYDFNLRVHPLSFFQIHTSVAKSIVDYLNNFIKTVNYKSVYDLYCGIGYFSLLTLNNECFAYGIDNNLYAIADAQFNAKRLNKHNFSYQIGDVLKTFTEKLFEKYSNPDIIILDPPRSGTLIEILKTIVKSNAKYIIYISCNPVALAWNLTYLISAYNIIDVKAFDMFPQTHQLETVVILEKK